MAKKSKIARNEQRKVVVERYAAKRAELKKTLVDPNATDEAREAARVGLQKLPRNASPARVRSRDVIDGRGVDMRAHGTRTMPVWGYEFWVDEGGDVTAQRAVRNAINKIVEHLRSIQRDDDRRAPDSVARQ